MGLLVFVFKLLLQFFVRTACAMTVAFRDCNRSIFPLHCIS